MPPGDADFSTHRKKIKAAFSRQLPRIERRSKRIVGWAEQREAQHDIIADIVGLHFVQPNLRAGFDKIIDHEAKFKHFNAQNEPIKSFDDSYGMCQLTTPTPSFEQIWNWKNNVDGGLALFASSRCRVAKRARKVAFLAPA